MGRITLLDGAMGTQLFASGLPSGTAPEVWNLQRPDVVTEIHRQYASAGAEVVTSNSFGGNAVRMRAAGLGALVAEVNTAAVTLARKAVALPVAGDVGPTGEILAPLGRLHPDEAYAAFREQASILVAAGADLLLLETFFHLQEALIALRAARSAATVPVWVTLTFRETPRGFFTVYGDSPLQALQTLLEEGAQMVGANCTIASRAMVALASEVIPVLGRATVFQPNAGQPSVKDQSIVYPESPEEFAQHMARLASLGPGALGGCCGTTPAHIAALAEALGDVR